jgi:hypothetical protein
MVDTLGGDTVQVDFGCLFDRGLILEVSISRMGACDDCQDIRMRHACSFERVEPILGRTALSTTSLHDCWCLLVYRCRRWCRSG